MSVSKTAATGMILAAGLICAATASAAARITPAQAEAAAVKKIPGTARSAKYEFEDGHWQYAVTVVNHAKQMYEVEVSTTGKVTDTEKTSTAEEATEAAADKKAAAKKSAH